MLQRKLVRAGVIACAGILAGCSFNAGVVPRTVSSDYSYGPRIAPLYGVNTPDTPLGVSYPPPGYGIGGGPHVIGLREHRNDEHANDRNRGVEEEGLQIRQSGQGGEQEMLRERGDHLVP